MTLEQEIIDNLYKARTALSIRQLTELSKITRHQSRIRSVVVGLRNAGQLDEINGRQLCYCLPRLVAVVEARDEITIQPQAPKPERFPKPSFGRQLRKYRGKQSQDKFSEKLGLSRTMLCDYENDRYSRWDRFVQKACKELNITPNDLFDYEAWK